MYQLKLTLAEKFAIEEQLMGRIHYLRGYKARVTDEHWNDSRYPDELQKFEDLYVKVRDSREEAC